MGIHCVSFIMLFYASHNPCRFQAQGMSPNSFYDSEHNRSALSMTKYIAGAYETYDIIEIRAR